MRKIILSRKGFDSENGGMPSAFVAGGEMVSFPIPADERSDLIRYADIRAENVSLQERIEQLNQGRRKYLGFPHERCHHDPDLVRDARVRPSLTDWTGVLGQSGSALGHLEGKGKARKKYLDPGVPVRKGDLFLFFGHFQQATKCSKTGMLHFLRDAPDLHALFGYLQVGKVAYRKDTFAPACFNDHPHIMRKHLSPEEVNPDALYIARKNLLLPGKGKKCKGWGVFRHSRELVLTADEEKSRTLWKLPNIFKYRKITYHTHSKKYGWRGDFFQSAHKGQEFIIFDDEDETVSKWAANLIRDHYLRS